MNASLLKIQNGKENNDLEMFLGILREKSLATQVLSTTQMGVFLARKDSAHAAATFAGASNYIRHCLDAFDELVKTHAKNVRVAQLELYVKRLRQIQCVAICAAHTPVEWVQCYDKIARYARGDRKIFDTQMKSLDVHMRVLAYNPETVTYRLATQALACLKENANVDQRRALAPISAFLNGIVVKNPERPFMG